MKEIEGTILCDVEFRPLSDGGYALYEVNSRCPEITLDYSFLRRPTDDRPRLRVVVSVRPQSEVEFRDA